MASQALNLADYWLINLRRTWRGSVVSALLTPFLYVLAMGVLLGGFVAGDPARLEGATSYLAFVAPGLLAGQVMQVAFGDSTYPVLGMLKWDKVYYAQSATSLRTTDLIAAHLCVIAIRLSFVAIVFGGILACFGVFDSVPGTVLAIALQPLIGMAFATPLFAYSAGIDDPTSFSVLFRLGVTPLFLFSGAFFPIANLPDGIEWLARITPLWQGVDLTRMLTVGQVDLPMAAVHLAYLTAMAVVGYLWAVRRLGRRLEQ